MPPRRRRQGRPENRNFPAPVAPAARAEPGNPAFQTTRLERFLRIAESVKETCVERIVDITILLGKFFRLLGAGIRHLNKVTYLLLIVASQLWLSISILENLVFLLVLSGIKFQFPLGDFAKFLVKSKKYMAWEFRLLVLSCVCIAFVNECIGPKKPPVERLKVLWNLFFAQIVMYSFIPFMNNFADVMNVVLAIFSCLAIAVEIAACLPEEMIASMNFLPHALMYHFLFISILGTYLTYYEGEKFMNKYMRVVPVVPPPRKENVAEVL